MKEFTVYYEHTEYGFYMTSVEGNDIQEALASFIKEWAYKQIYGIMSKS